MRRLSGRVRKEATGGGRFRCLALGGALLGVTLATSGSVSAATVPQSPRTVADQFAMHANVWRSSWYDAPPHYLAALEGRLVTRRLHVILEQVQGAGPDSSADVVSYLPIRSVVVRSAPASSRATLYDVRTSIEFVSPGYRSRFALIDEIGVERVRGRWEVSAAYLPEAGGSPPWCQDAGGAFAECTIFPVGWK